jgi:phage shock protein E
MRSIYWFLLLIVMIIITVLVIYPYISDLRIPVSEARNTKFDVYLDVRTYTERQYLGYYPNSLHIPSDKLKLNVRHEIPNKNTRILVYCNTGHRARKAAELLRNLGYTNVRYIVEPYALLLI